MDQKSKKGFILKSSTLGKMSQTDGFRGIKRIMVFIDGGYVVKNLHDGFNGKTLAEINLAKLAQYLKFGAAHPMVPDFIRAYYYDALPEDLSLLSAHRKLILDNIRGENYFQMRRGKLAKFKSKQEPERQKRVDTLIAIDMLSKAYENHYDVAVLISGDDDFFDLVEAVKDAGKRVFGVYFNGHISEDLKCSFDKIHILDRDFLLEKEMVRIAS